MFVCVFFFSSRRRHTRCSRDWSSDVCSSDLKNRTLCPANPRRSTHVHLRPHGLRLRAHRQLPYLRFPGPSAPLPQAARRSEEHTSELQSRLHLVCRLLLEKKKQKVEQ